MHHHEGDRETAEILLKGKAALLDQPPDAAFGKRQLLEKHEKRLDEEKSAEPDVGAASGKEFPELAAELVKEE